MTAIPKPKPWMSADDLMHNIKRRFGDRGMLDSNNKELNNIFEQVGDLSKARKMQKANWDKLPSQGMKTGVTVGLGASTLTGANATTNKEPRANTVNLPKPWTSSVGVGILATIKRTGKDSIFLEIKTTQSTLK